jgi:hypothetical protein
VAGSSRRSGVPVEGGSDGVAAFLGAVLWLQAEAREGTVGAASERDEKHGVGEKFRPATGGSTLLMGSVGCSGGGPGSRATHGVERGRERGGGQARWKMARAVRVSAQWRAAPGR